MARLFPAALRGESLKTTPAYNSALVEQLAASVGRAGDLDLDALLSRVSERYDSLDAERRGAVLSMHIMSHEAQALARAISLEMATRLDLILGRIGDAVITLDPFGRVEAINAAAERLFGYPEREIAGMPLDVLLPGSPAAPGAHGRLIEFLDLCAAAGHHPGAPAARAIAGRTRDGTELMLELSVSIAAPGRGTGYLAFINDISGRQRGALLDAAERRIFAAIAAGASLQAVLSTIAEVIEGVLPHAHCTIDLLDAELQVLRHAVAPSMSRAFVAAMDGAPVGLTSGSSAAAAHLRRPILVADIAAEPSWVSRAAVAAHAGLRSAWVEPIAAADGAIVGTIAIYRRLAGLPQPCDAEWLARLAQIAAGALARGTHAARPGMDASRNGFTRAIRCDPAGTAR